MSFFSSLTRPDPASRARRRAVAGLTLSVLVHAGLFLIVRDKLDTPPVTSGNPESPLQVTFITPPKPAPRPEPAKEAPPPPPKPAPAKPKPKAAKSAKAAPKRSAAPARSRQTPAVRSTPSPTPAAPPVAQATPENDFSTMINRNRARREAAEESARQENEAARAAETPSANDIAKANIAFQEKRGRGTNGVFEIVSKGPRVAQYSFRGWTSDQRRSQRQIIEVDAGPGGNVELAIVDSMIALIRKYYTGDFNWDSQRLGRVVVLSARVSDTAGLQAVLMKEFFSDNR